MRKYVSQLVEKSGFKSAKPHQEVRPEKKLKFRFNPARTDETPAAKRFKNGEQACRHQNNSQPEIIVHHDDARDETQRSDDAARDASVMVDVPAEKTVHTRRLAQCVPKTTVRYK